MVAHRDWDHRDPYDTDSGSHDYPGKCQLPRHGYRRQRPQQFAIQVLDFKQLRLRLKYRPEFESYLRRREQNSYL